MSARLRADHTLKRIVAFLDASAEDLRQIVEEASEVICFSEADVARCRYYLVNAILGTTKGIIEAEEESSKWKKLIG